MTLIEVPVHVVDRDDVPIRGLGPGDFELYDDGRRQAIESVEKVDLALLSPDDDPRRLDTKRAVEQMPAAARRHVLLLFDLGFSRPAAIQRARAAARRFVLESLHATDLAAVATFSAERGPQLLVTFTADRAQLARAVETLGAPSLLRQGPTVDPLHLLIDAPGQASADLTDDGGFGREAAAPDLESAVAEHLAVLTAERTRAQAANARGRIRRWSRSLADMARILASIDGRKQVVYFSEGPESALLLGRDAGRDREGADADQRRREDGELGLLDQDATFGSAALQEDVAATLEAFRRADCVIQAVDIGGLRTEAPVDGAAPGRRRAGGNRDALFHLADATGGRLVESVNDLGQALEAVLERHAVTYVLSFYPENLAFDGAFHRLEVRAAAELPRGARLTHRSGYYAPRRYDALHPLEKSLLASHSIVAATPRREIDVAMLTAPFRAAPGRAYVPVILEIDGRTLLGDQAGERLDVEIYVYATDPRGEVRDFVTQIVSFDLGPARARMLESGVKYYAHLDLGPDDYRIRALVRNAETGRTAVTSRDLRVPSDVGSAEVHVLPPFFLEPPNRWFMAREDVTFSNQAFPNQASPNLASSDPESVAYPFLYRGEPYVPAARPALRRGESARFCLVVYDIGADEIELDTRLLDSTGQVAPGGRLELLERTETDPVKILASFDPPGLEPGDYTLEVTVRSVESDAAASSAINLRID